MPHTNRKKPKQHAGKLKNVQADDEWQVVVRSNHAAGRRGIDGNRIDPGPPRNETGATVEDLRKTYEKRRGEFERSDCRAAVARWVTDCLKASNGPAIKIDKAICLALGSFTRLTDDRSLWQLAAFMVLIHDMAAANVRVLVKDPAFSKTDLSFLESLDITVLEPGAELEVDEHTFMFVPFLEAEIECSIIAHATACPVYISHTLDGIAGYLERIERDKADTTTEARQALRLVLQEFRQRHTSLNFPEVDKSGFAFTGLQVHLLQYTKSD